MRAVFIATIILILRIVPADALNLEEETLFEGASGGTVLTMLSTTDTAIFAPLLEAFQDRTPDISIRYLVASSQAVFSAIAEGDIAADLVISSAMDLQMKLANDGFASEVRTGMTLSLPDWARWHDQLFGFTQEPVVIAWSLGALGALPPPDTRGGLIQLLRDEPDRFRGKIGTYDPRGSGAGYLFATQDARQSDTFWRLSEVIGGLEPKLYVSTSAMIDDLQSGTLALAYNVLGSYLAPRLAGWADGGMVEMRDFTHVLLRTAFVPRNAPEPEAGRAFLDFLLSKEGQHLLTQETGLDGIDETAFASGPHLRPIRLDPGLLVYVDPFNQRRFLSEWASAYVRD